MTRAIRLSCVALLFVALGATSALAKPTIAVLGLEVIDKSGTPTPVDTQVAQELTTGLRDRVKTGGPYQPAPNSDKELIDEKLLKNCDDEKPTCMAAIGTELTAEFLMYGSITKQGGAYQATVNLLDVKRKHKDTTTVLIPIAESSGTAVKGWAKKVYSSLTGQVDTCSITIKTTGGVDQGTIKVNNELKGTVTAGSGEVKGLAEGKYDVVVEAKDFKPYKASVQCTAGQATTISPEMTKVEIGIGPGSGSGSGSDGGMGSGSGSGSDTVTHPKSHKGVWTAVAWGALAGSAIAGGAWAYGYFVDVSPYSGKKWEVVDSSGHTIFDDPDPMSGHKNPTLFKDSDCSKASGLENITADNRMADDASGMYPDHAIGQVQPGTGNKAFGKACSGYTITKFAIPLTIGLAAVAVGGFIMAYRSNDKESPVQVSRTGTASNGHRVKHQPFVIVPVVGPNGGGATFAMQW